METNSVFKKIKEIGHINSRREELQEYCKLNSDEILKQLPSHILNSDGADVLDCLFNGFTDSSLLSTIVKVKIVDIVLKSFRDEPSSLTHCGDVISRLCLEVTRSPIDDLVRWSNDSVQSVMVDSDVNMIWRNILPECVNAIFSYDHINHSGTEMTPSEFRELCVRTLCQCKWNEKQLVPLTAMFTDMDLPYLEHMRVVNCMCASIRNVSPETLPPLLHQLLKLCKYNKIETVLAHLTEYFNVRLYSKLEPPRSDSESTTMDIEDFVPHSLDELSRCLSTCLYHVSQGAAAPALVLKRLKRWPRAHLLRSPFLLDLALVISEKGPDFRAVCLDVIRSAIEQRALDDLKSKESAWVRAALPSDVNVVSVLNILTAESSNHRLTVVGLINLAFSLLSVSRQKQVAPICWSHGKRILVRLCKAQPETAGHILTQLSDRLISDLAERQYAECLFVLCNLTPLSVETCTQMVGILENCQPAAAEYRSAAAVLEAVHPLLNFSTKIRDSMIMICRKRLFSREWTHRCLALSGFLSVLRHARLGAGGAGAAGAGAGGAAERCSAHSYLTQLTLDLHATHDGAPVTSRIRNETMCMEIVSILKRCLLQDAAVKQLLYSSIYYSTKQKTSLHEPIFEMLYEHLAKYLPENDTGSPLLWDECVKIKDSTVTLTEPIGYLLYAVAEFLQAVDGDSLEDILGSQAADTGSAHLKSKLTDILEKLTSADQLCGFELEGEHGLSDLTPESKAKSLKIQQVLQCYEALMAHHIMQCDAKTDNISSVIFKLYKSYNQLLDYTKTPPKVGKKASKSTLNDTRDTDKTQRTQRSQKEKGTAVKVSNLIKDRAGPFKPLPCLWNLNFCSRIVELLYSESVPWCGLEQRNRMRARRELHQFALRRARAALAAAAPAHAHCRRALAAHAPAMAAVLFKRCLCKFQDIYDFDETTALLCVELFNDCMSLFLSNNYGFKVDRILPDIICETDKSVSENVAAILECVHAALEQLEAVTDTQTERDLITRKITNSLLQLATVVLEIPVEENCSRSTAVISELEQFVRSSRSDWLPLLPALLAAGCRDHQDAPLLDELLAKMAAALGRIDEESEEASSESFPLVAARGAQAALAGACAHAAARGAHAELALARAAELAAGGFCLTALARRRLAKDMKELNQSLVVQLCQLAAWAGAAARLRCAVGAPSDRVLQLAIKLYALLSAFVKHLLACFVAEGVEILHAVRLERLMKLSGKKLSSVMDNLITYLEASQPQQQGANRVLRDTKNIPRLVLEMEQFVKNVVILSTKSKIDYQQYMPIGTARDFRIKGPLLEEALNARDDSEEDVHDAETDILTPVGSDKDGDSHSDDERASDSKRSRTSQHK